MYICISYKKMGDFPIGSFQGCKPWEFFFLDVSVLIQEEISCRFFPRVQGRFKIKHQIVGLGLQYLFGRERKILPMVNPWDDLGHFPCGGNISPPSQMAHIPVWWDM